MDYIQYDCYYPTFLILKNMYPGLRITLRRISVFSLIFVRRLMRSPCGVSRQTFPFSMQSVPYQMRVGRRFLQTAKLCFDYTPLQNGSLSHYPPPQLSSLSLRGPTPRVEAGKNTSTVIPASRKRRRKGNPVV
jgi:hypothetical protein